jgi:AbrB family looped-hinge helix DNA binding protein
MPTGSSGERNGRLQPERRAMKVLALCLSMKNLTLTQQSKESGMRITSKGQVTIPIEIREQAGLMPNTEVEFEFDGKSVRIVPSTARSKDSRGSRLVAHLRGRGDVAITTEAIMALTRDDLNDRRSD